MHIPVGTLCLTCITGEFVVIVGREMHNSGQFVARDFPGRRLIPPGDIIRVLPITIDQGDWYLPMATILRKYDPEIQRLLRSRPVD